MEVTDVSRISGWSYVLTWGQQALTAITALVLAAWLGPEKYGLVAIAMALVMLMQLLTDQGLTVALIQHPDPKPAHLDTTFWTVAALCAALTLAVWLVAGPWAEANDDPQIAAVLWGLSPLIALRGLAVVPTALLRRALGFRRLAMLTSAALAAGGVVAIALVVSGAGVWALVGQHLVSEGLTTVLLWRAAGWRPGTRVGRAAFGELWAVAGGAFIAAIGHFVVTRSDVFLMGLFLGPAAVGLFRLAVRISELVLTLTMRPIALVALPLVSRAQGDPAEVRRLTGQCLRLATGLSVPGLLLTGAASPWILATVGPDWAPGWPALALLSLVGVTNASIGLVPQILNALGRAWMAAAQVWLRALASVPAIALAAWSARGLEPGWQAAAVALAILAVAVAVGLPVAARQLARATGAEPGRSLAVLLRPQGLPALAGLAGAAAAAATGWLAGGDWPPVLVLLAAGGLGGAVALGALMALDRTRISEPLAPFLARLRR